MKRSILEDVNRSNLLQWVGDYENSRTLAVAVKEELEVERSQVGNRLKHFDEQGSTTPPKKKAKGQRTEEPDVLDLLDQQAVYLQKQSTSLQKSVDALRAKRQGSGHQDEQEPVSVIRMSRLSAIVLRTEPFVYEVRVAVPDSSFEWSPSPRASHSFLRLDGTATLVQEDDIEPAHQATFTVVLPFLVGELTLFSNGYGEGVFYERGLAGNRDPFAEFEQQLAVVADVLAKSVYGL